MLLMRFSELGSTGSLEISWFQGLSSGRSRLPPKLALGPSLTGLSLPPLAGFSLPPSLSATHPGRTRVMAARMAKTNLHVDFMGSPFAVSVAEVARLPDLRGAKAGKSGDFRYKLSYVNGPRC